MGAAMHKDEMRARLRGVLVYVVTPYLPSEDLPVDERGLAQNVRFLSAAGVHGIVPCGGTGEFWSLSDEEYRRVLNVAREATSIDTLVVPGVGGALAKAIAQARHAEACGCEAIMVFTPPGRIPETGHVAYVRAVASSTNLAVMPYLTTPMSLGALDSLVDIPNVVAIKDASWDLGWFRRAFRAVGPRVNWMCEGESLAPYYLLHGGSGITSGVANFVPHLVIELYEAAERGDFRRAGEIQRLLDPWAELRAKPGNHVPVVKAALERFGLTGGPVRLPLMPLAETDRQELDRLVTALQAATKVGV